MASKKRILIFAHYYHPDVASTGQILKDLAEGMLSAFDVTVICVVPSYSGAIEDKYKIKKYYYENINGVKVIRIRVPEFSKTSKVSRIKNIIAYFFGALGAARKSGKQDYVFTISQPPILGGLLGVLCKWMKHAKMIYCIQDFNPEQTIAVGYCKNKFILKAMLWLDKLSCKHSNLVITVGCDLVETLEKRFDGGKMPKTVMINNWIDENEIYPLPENHPAVQEFKIKFGIEDKFIVMYSGNIGLYYDLENLIKIIEKFKTTTKAANGKEVVFAFVGEGTMVDVLKNYVNDRHMNNVIFIPYQDKTKLIYSLNAGDIHWCVNAKGIKGVSCPSKAYGIMAVGRAILGCLESGTEVRKLIEKCNCGKCCEPGDYEDIEKMLRWYIENADSDNIKQMGINGREYLQENLSKSVSIKKYMEEILKL